MAEAMYDETVRNSYFSNSSDPSFATSVFRMNRYFLGYNYVSMNNDDDNDDMHHEWYIINV